MSRFGNLIGGTPQQPEPEPKVEIVEVQESIELVVELPELVVEEEVVEPVAEEVVEQPKRARDDNGHFIADDPSTPENEAWEGGVAPKRTRKRRSKKS